MRVFGQALEGGLRVKTASKSKTRPPTSIIPGDESRRRRKGTPSTNLLHLDLVVHVRVAPLNFVDLRLFDELEGEPLGVALPRYFIY